MNAKSATFAVLSAAVVVGGGASALAAAGSDSTGGAAVHYRAFTVVERAVTDTTADTGPAGDSLGDVLAFNNPVFDATNTHRVGRDNGSCIRTVVGDAYDCTWSLALRDGSIMVQGPFYDSRDSKLTITGGTGSWRGARGEMRLHARDAAGSAYDFTYRVAT